MEDEESADVKSEREEALLSASFFGELDGGDKKLLLLIGAAAAIYFLMRR